jgi:hypothetical protein
VLYAYLVNERSTMASTIGMTGIVGTTNITYNTSITTLFSHDTFSP